MTKINVKNVVITYQLFLRRRVHQKNWAGKNKMDKIIIIYLIEDPKLSRWIALLVGLGSESLHSPVSSSGENWVHVTISPMARHTASRKLHSGLHKPMYTQSKHYLPFFRYFSQHKIVCPMCNTDVSVYKLMWFSCIQCIEISM